MLKPYAKSLQLTQFYLDIQVTTTHGCSECVCVCVCVCEAVLRPTAVGGEEGGSPLGRGGEVQPNRTQRPVEDRVERGGEAWS